MHTKNRLQWTFSDFFSDPAEGQRISLVLAGAPVLPKAWAHHLLRFDADLGLLEYLVDGRLAALEYATSTGREEGEVYTPIIGEDGSMVLGGRFSGLMDEFRLYGHYMASPVLARYPREGRAETRTIDLGQANSRVLKIEAFGGRSINLAGGMRNSYAGNGNLSFSDYSELRFFARANDTPYRWNDVPWVPVAAGADLGEVLAGRYIQVAADFYPSGNGEATPYLDELRIVYQANEPPPPPALVTAIARDGAVELSWRAVPSQDLGGYLVYYGTSSGEYFGEHAILEGRELKSPVNAGLRNSVRIEGLKNGTLYYFAVAAYDKTLKEAGMFSREAAARPLRQPAQGL
nr:fibronectin type III domain-containing protein [Leadbettera azotonutricia]